MFNIKSLTAVIGLLLLTACGGAPEVGRDGVEAMTEALMQMNPNVRKDEAARAAAISYRHTAELAQAYEITDPPIVHNTKVNMGLKPRGLCRHWAEDMEKRLKAENFQTLEIHRAIATPANPLRLEHSTAIISAKGDDMFSGMVVDPWREGGKLTWTPTRADPDYAWRPREEVMAEKRAKLRRRQHLDATPYRKNFN